MKTCQTCRFFGAPMGVLAWIDDEERETEHHACARIVHGNDGCRFPHVANEPAIVTDGSGFAARLRVLPSFGCALHEEKS